MGHSLKKKKKLRNTLSESLKIWAPLSAIQCWQQPKLVQFVWKVIWHNLASILKVFMLLDSVIPLWGICPEEISRGSDTDVTHMVLLIGVKSCKQPKYSTVGEWLLRVSHWTE